METLTDVAYRIAGNFAGAKFRGIASEGTEEIFAAPAHTEAL